MFDGKAFVATLPRRPGVYRMYSADGEIIYIGKAVSLRDRVGSYFNPGNVDPKVQALVAQIAAMEVTVARSETEALLLEYSLIKQHRPRFNVMLRDDKSFPSILVTTEHEYPRLQGYRGARTTAGRYFGPYPNASAMWETIYQLQKVFRIRNCRDSFFENRSRPCLQYQIGRCTAPCVNLISREDYQRDVQSAIRVLEGRDTELNEALAAEMERAAEALQFERAARLRDQLAALKQIQAAQGVTDEDREADAIALTGEPGDYAVSVLMVRGGRNLGSSASFLRAAFAEPAEALASFVMQYYDAGHEPPPEILTSVELPDARALAEALREVHGRAVRIHRPMRGAGVRWMELAAENAAQALRMRRAKRDSVESMRAALAEALELPAVPQRMECFDVSHTAGEGTVASCVVFGPEGPLKKDYRRFNITGVTPGDDYAALRQALERRYARVAAGEIERPDVLFIDGGPGQIAGVHAVLEQLGVLPIALVGVAKGPDRRAGQERLFVHGESTPRVPGPASPALHLVQRIRDEAHRFAIAGHRRRRARRFNESVLESVPGLGPAKRRALLRAFGGLQGILRAGVADFEQIEGVGPQLARTLYDHLHPGE